MQTEHLIDQFISHLRIERGLSDLSVEAYAADLTRYAGFLEENGFKAPGEDDTYAILKHMITLRDEGLGARSRARHLVSIRSFYRFLAEEKILSNDPSGLIDFPKTGVKLPDTLSVSEVKSLLNAPDPSTPRGMRDSAMIELLYAAGLRVSELINLEVRNIHLDAGIVRVFGKGGEQGEGAGHVDPLAARHGAALDRSVATAEAKVGHRHGAVDRRVERDGEYQLAFTPVRLLGRIGGSAGGTAMPRPSVSRTRPSR